MVNIDKIMDMAYNLITSNIDDVSESLFQPKGLWFYVGYNSNGEYYRSSILTQSTKLNPFNWSNDEWVIVFNCNNDMDDIDVGMEVEAFQEWLYNLSSEDLKDMILFPKRDLTLPRMIELEYI